MRQRRATALTGSLTACLLLLAVAGCGADTPNGTLSEDDLPSGVKVEKVTHDDQAGQVTCPEVNNAEDEHVMTPSDNYDRDRRATVSYRLSGSHRETVSDSVWRLARPTEAVARVATGLDACVQANPENYQRFEVESHPDAVGYTAREGTPHPVFTRRILVPLTDRVVVVTTTRQDDDHFAVAPEDVLNKAITASKDAPKA